MQSRELYLFECLMYKGLFWVKFKGFFSKSRTSLKLYSNCVSFSIIWCQLFASGVHKYVYSMSTSKSWCASKITIHCEVTLTKPSCLSLFICKILSNKEVIFTILPTNVCYRPVNIYIYIYKDFQLLLYGRMLHVK